MAVAKPILIRTRILDYDRTALAADDADYTVNKGSKPNLIFVAQLDEEKGAYASPYTLMLKNTTDAGSFTNLAATGEINWAATTNLVQGTAVTARSCTGAGASGSTWQNGEEVEGAATCDSINLADEYYTEVHFAINISGVHEGDTYDFQVWENTGGTALAAAAAASLIVTSDQPSTVLNTADAYEFTTATPTLEFTGTDGSDSDIRYNIQIDSDSRVGDEDSQATSNIGNWIYGGTAASSETNQAIGQTITPSNSYNLKSFIMQLKKTGSPTDNLSVSVYTGSETGTLLGTSDSISGSTITTSNADYTFTFSPVISLSSGTTYYFVITRSGARDTSNYYNPQKNSSSGYAGGVARHRNSNVWEDGAGDLYFYVKSQVLLDKVSGTDAGFANTVTPADTDPFNSGEKCDYDVQAGDALADGTYYWRVRGMDPSPGSGSYGSWAATRSFTVSTGGLTKDLSDTITLSDASAKAVSTARADTVTLSDSPAKSLATSRADSVSLSDGFAKVYRKYLADTVSLSDGFSDVSAFARTFPDTVSLSDDFGRAASFVRSEGDTVNLSDEFARDASFVRGHADTVNLSDGFGKANIFNRGLGDTINLSDVAIKSPRLNRADTIALSDEYARVIAYLKTFPDSVSLSDGIAKSANISKADTVMLADEIISMIRSLLLTLNDTINLSDGFGRTATFARGLSDTINLSDSSAKISSVPLADTISLSDESTRGLWLNKADTVSLADAIAKAAGLSKSDALSLADFVLIGGVPFVPKIKRGLVMGVY